jgi:hypothetical protein
MGGDARRAGIYRVSVWGCGTDGVSGYVQLELYKYKGGE